MAQVEKCKVCAGNGYIDCPICDGAGKLRNGKPATGLRVYGSGDETENCHTCQGTGRRLCKICDGAGKVLVDKPETSGFRSLF